MKFWNVRILLCVLNLKSWKYKNSANLNNTEKLVRYQFKYLNKTLRPRTKFRENIKIWYAQMLKSPASSGAF